jgi:hypothetical protein
MSAVAPGSEGRMKVTLKSLGTPTVEVTTDQGLPYNLNLYSVGCSSKSNVVTCTPGVGELFSRKIQVNIRTGNPEQN